MVVAAPVQPSRRGSAVLARLKGVLARFAPRAAPADCAVLEPPAMPAPGHRPLPWAPRRAPAGPPGAFSRRPPGALAHRHAMLYEPARPSTRPRALLVMLHGCSQSAETFAASTGMNAAAEAAGVMVLYPEQSRLANALRCWNWHARHAPAQRGGEAAWIAELVAEVVREHPIDPQRIYVAGMSAGGAMAAVLAREHPTLFAAYGVHSGVPAGIAHDLISALRLMARGPLARSDGADSPERDRPGQAAPTLASIVFHGDDDAIVHASNGIAIHDRRPTQGGAPTEAHSVTTRAHGGKRGYTRSIDLRADGVSERELWIVHGAGHAWSGGHEDAEHTDADGPDASREMLRFFLQHRAARAPLNRPAEPA